MAKEKKETGAEAPEVNAETAPQVAMLAQYVRDLSFENPNAPASLQNDSEVTPAIDVNVNVGGRKAGDDVYEVELKLTVSSKKGDQVSFVVELSYASLFGIRNVPEDAIGQIMLIQAPTLMFPFARRVIADAVRDGGFPPLMLDPISFEALYRQQAEQAGAEGAAATDGADVSESITVN